jgi:outer membrane protein assembly factor BamB
MSRVKGLAISAAVALIPVIAFSQGLMGGGAATPNSTGMLTVASDGSLLATQMGMSMMGGPGGGASNFQRAVVNIGTDGKERWRATFDTAWPMMSASNGDLVVVVLVNNAWMWRGMSGYGWFPFGTPPTSGSTDGALVGLDLATGAQRWKTTLPGDMASLPQFAPDGTRVYVSVTDFGSAGMMGSGSIRQGDTGGWATQMTNKVVAVDRNGNVLWTADLSKPGGMMP